MRSTVYTKYFHKNTASRELPEIQVSVTRKMFTTKTGTTETSVAADAYRIEYTISTTSSMPEVYITGSNVGT